MFYGSTLYGQSPYATILKKKNGLCEIYKGDDLINQSVVKIVKSNGNLIQLSTIKFSKKPDAFTPKEQC